ncbi:hemolysin E-like [Drosophila rhopaloa]|uniref:Hemolysin E-like n=1 Tax=Drosophila rhopaloa TaxID=1041015 RepID=A0A6P4F6A0_DRORH|nr:hemolysin E-like [Drosophila rhopaloa]
MKCALLVLFAVGLSSARTITYHNLTVSSDEIISDEDILKNLTQSVYAFHQSMDDYIDWVSFDNIFEEMIKHSGELAVSNMGSIRSYFLKSRDFYFDAVASVYEWCATIDIMMTTYVYLFEDYTEQVKELQKDCLNETLNNGIKLLTRSVELLDQSRNHVNTGITDLSNVMSKVTNAFRNDQKEDTATINDLNKQTMNVLEKSLFNGIVSIIMVETIYKPEVQKKFDLIKSSFDFMNEKVRLSIKKGLEIKEKLSLEIVYITGLRGTVSSNKLTFGGKYMFPVLKMSANKLKNECSTYQTRHIKKTE